MRKLIGAKATPAALALSLACSLALVGCDASGGSPGPAADPEVKAAMQIFMEAENDAKDGIEDASTAPELGGSRINPSIISRAMADIPELAPITIDEIIDGDISGTIRMQGTYTFNADMSSSFQGTNTYSDYTYTAADGTPATVNGTENMSYTSAMNMETGVMTLNMTVQGTVNLTHGGKTVPLVFDFGFIMTLNLETGSFEYDLTGTINGVSASEYGLEITVEADSGDTSEEPAGPPEAPYEAM